MPSRASAPPRRDRRLTLLAGLTPAEFLRRHWQRKPLLIRAAIPNIAPVVSRARLFALARRSDVESRVIARSGERWTLAHGPLKKCDFPPLDRRGWTLLVQGVDLHDDAARALLERFRFVPDARLDDLMISWASVDGGVGPHYDSYDVFLLQAHGRRRWGIGRTRDRTLAANQPLKILERFEPEEEHVLEAGDMLYLPPHWSHDGVALDGGCTTYSIGFRAPRRAELAIEIAERLLEGYEDDEPYRDPGLVPRGGPAQIPAALERFASASVANWLRQPDGIACALGESLTEPKPGVSFDEPDRRWSAGAVVLDRRTRLLYDGRHVYVNGESVRARGADARLLRRLADERALDAATVRGASRAARALLAEWFASGWLHRRS